MLTHKLAGLGAGRGVFSITIAINKNGIGSSLNTRRVLWSGGHVWARAFPEGFGDAGPSCDGDEMGVVGRSRKGESEVGFFDLGGGAEVAGEDAVAVGEEFQLVGPDPGRP